jgi:hypothetical protein
VYSLKGNPLIKRSRSCGRLAIDLTEPVDNSLNVRGLTADGMLIWGSNVVSPGLSPRSVSVRGRVLKRSR